jgi:multidrug efflux pump subunit AcrB
MKRVIKRFVEYPFYGKMVVAILLILGTVSYLNMNKDSFPITETNTISVMVSYPGATPQEMNEGVTTLIENSIRGLPGIKEFTSSSRENFSQVTITAEFGYDIDELLIDVKNAVDGISNFPAGAEKPVVSKRRSTAPAMFLSLVSSADDRLAMNDMANRIEDDLLGSGVISQVSIFGLPSSRIEMAVTIDETQLRRYNLSLSDLQNAIRSNNLDIHGGTIRNPREQIKVVSRQRSVKAEQIKDIVVKSNPMGRLIRIGDVADVELKYQEDPSESYVKGNPSATIFIQKLSNEDLGEISEYVNQYMQDFNESHQNFRIRALHDFNENIDSQLSILINNGILGVLLVVVMLTLLLNFRLSLWVAWGIPASFLGMFIVASLYGITINVISLVGMILIIGILVDDGIVIGENIFTHFERGKSPRLAAIDGTIEVLPAVLTSITTTIIAFSPLFFIEGNMEILYAMGFVVIFSLVFSLIEGVFVLPAHVGNPTILNKREKTSKASRFTTKVIHLLRDRLYMPLLNRVLAHKGFMLSLVTALLILTGGLMISGKIPFTFFPPQPSDMFTIDLALKPGVNREITKEKLFHVEEQLYQVNQELMEQYGDGTSYVRTTAVSLGSSFNGTESGTHAGMIRVFLNPLEGSTVSDQTIKRALDEKIGELPGAYKFTIGGASRFGAPVSISLLGYDMDKLKKAQEELETGLADVDALFNISNNSQLGSQEIRLKLKPKAYALGLTQAGLMDQVRKGFYGGLAQRIQDGKDEIWFYVRYPQHNRETMGQLESMMIQTPAGEYPLTTVAELTKARSLSTINGYNGKREIRVDAYLKDKSNAVPPILDYVEKNILSGIMAKYPALSYEYQGQKKDTDQQAQSMTRYFGIAFLVIVLVIMIYFKSFRQGTIILLTIPLGFMGAIWGHVIHDEPVSMLSLWGLIALTGTIINGSVVFMAKYNQNLVAGYRVLEGAIEAARSRFRPLFLTTVTTFSGLMPLILEGSPDAQFLIPMAISVAYGILFGSIFILLTLPIQIVLFNRFQYRLKRFFGKKDVTPESVEAAVINHQIDQYLEKAIEEEESKNQK